MTIFLKTRVSYLSGVQCAPSAIKFISVAALLSLFFACTPAFNWREVGFEDQPVTALLPCKPDRGTRTVSLAGGSRTMTMLGCETGGATFTLAVVDVGDVQKVASAKAELKAMGKATHSLYAQHGSLVVQAAVYGEPRADGDGPGALSTQAIETFFGGLKLPSKP